MAYSVLHTALEAVVNVLLAYTPCQEIDIVQKGYYDVTLGSISTARYEVICKKEDSPRQYVVSAKMPTTYLNGDSLSCDVTDIILNMENKVITLQACKEGSCSTKSESVTLE